jgi:pimeloyl-ACP methyl ester carboxylesterase
VPRPSSSRRRWHRGDSGDADEYSLAREIEDLEALLGVVQGDVMVFGHSFGGLLTLAATERLDVHRLILYEPAVLVGDHRGNDLASRTQTCLDTGDREAAMKMFFQEGGGVPAPEELPIWPDGVNFDLVETVIRENHAVESYELPTDPAIDCPTLLLTGEHEPTHLRDAVRTLADRVSQSHFVEFDGIGHVGTHSAPEQVAAPVRCT